MISKMDSKFIKTIFALYCLALAYILFFYRMGSDIGCTYIEWITNMISPIPFWSFYDFFTTPIITAEYTLSFIKNIIGNLMLFMPMGFFLPHLLKKTRQFKYYIILICIMVLSVEIIQLFTTLGMFDIDDVIFNVAGAALGFCLSKRIESAVKRHRMNK